MWIGPFGRGIDFEGCISAIYCYCYYVIVIINKCYLQDRVDELTMDEKIYDTLHYQNSKDVSILFIFFKTKKIQLASCDFDIALTSIIINTNYF